MIYENDLVRVEVEKSSIPWLKIFTKKPYKEFSECDKTTKEEIWRVLDVIEKEMLSYYNPTKINIASFGNYVPLVHFHIMARFKEDSHYPEPMWGEKQRNGELNLPDFEEFKRRVVESL